MRLLFDLLVFALMALYDCWSAVFGRSRVRGEEDTNEIRRSNMKKVISLFKRDYDGTRLVYDEVVPGAEWVLAGEGIATVKFDGTSCMVRAGVLYKRYDLKRGRKMPVDFSPAQEPDPVTGHWPGWVPIGDGPEDKWHREAWAHFANWSWEPDREYTFELVGPKVQGNPYGLDRHELWFHGGERFVNDPPCDFGGLRTWFKQNAVEGIVWHHGDGRMVKLKRRDFGLPWPPRKEDE